MKLSTQKVLDIHKVLNNIKKKEKPKINMTTKGSLRKQVIVPISLNNVNRIMTKLNKHIININRSLKGIKFNISVDYIWLDNRDIVITTNRVAAKLDIKAVEKYMKNLNNIDSTEVINPRLLQSKSYLKILEIPYFINNIKISILSDIVDNIIKIIHIFDNIVLSLYLQVIKTSPKSNMIVVWIHIWDLKNNINTKCLINKCFNIGYYITMIKGMDMNSGVL